MPFTISDRKKVNTKRNYSTVHDREKAKSLTMKKVSNEHYL